MQDPRPSALQQLRRAFCIGILVLSVPQSASAETLRIVALGASNTEGKGVGSRSAWPARLEAMLRANGYDVRVDNKGIRGHSTRQMRARMDRDIPRDTSIAILERPIQNDRRDGVSTDENIAAMTAALEARGVETIVIRDNFVWADFQLQGDGKHLSTAGHDTLAARLLPLVVAELND